MNILIVSATYPETAPLHKAFEGTKKTDTNIFSLKNNTAIIDLLIAGVGIASTAFYIGKAFSKKKYDCAFNFGIAGSFNKSSKLGDIVNVNSDVISELGAENGNSFLKFSEMKMSAQIRKRTAYIIENKYKIQISVISKITCVKGITVNTVHGNKSSIEKAIRLYSPDVESMEGAAFLYACNHEKINCAQIRSISNYVGERNLKNWNSSLAIKNLNEVAIQIIRSL